MGELWFLWLPMAFVAPLLWAMVSTLDLYFVRGLYQDEWDGTLISGAFQFFPWLLVALGMLPFTWPTASATIYALAGGGMFLASFFFYFRALFRHADVALIQILWNVAILVVPVMAWAWSDESLLPAHYFGIVLAFFGSSLFAARGGLLRWGFLRVAGIMVWAVLLFSASMVLQEEAYRHAHSQFLDVYLVFSLGVAGAAALLAMWRPRMTAARVRRFAGMKPGFIALLVSAEGVSFAGTVFSQRAIDLSPSPSFIAAIESSVPVFVMLYSLLLASVFTYFDRAHAATIFRNQILGWQEKLAAVSLMSVGIYCIAG
jgi:drug/metabolite transporter (DMT)-like permease